MNNLCLITHIADPDGAFPIVLSKLVFDKIDIFSCEVKEVDEILKKILNNNYEKIYIVDLNVSDEMAEIIDANKYPVEIYDHHESKQYLNKYPFIHVIVEENNKKECGTTIFYKHLLEISNNDILKRNSLKQMIELIRQNDTYDFTDELKEKAFKFTNLYNIYGRENYIEHCIEFIKANDEFKFTETEETLLKLEEERKERYIIKKMEKIRICEIDGIKVGVVFAESNRSILGNRIAEELKDKIDIAILIDVDRSVSYRAIKDEVDVNVLATKYNGGGHKHAAGSPLPENLDKKILEIIFKEIKWEENNAN